MTWYVALLLQMGGLLALLMLGLPVVFAFLAVNIVGALFFLGGEPGLAQLVRNAVDAVTTFTLTPIPLFLLMGEVMFHTGLAHKAIDAVDKLIARVPGRLSLVAVVSGTIFSALSGSTLANTAMLGSTLLPEMRRRGYEPKIAMGPILGTGGIAMLIPPSALAVILASLAMISVADLLIAGILPGIVMATLFFGYVIVRCWLNPALAPGYDVGHLTLGERLRPLFVNVVPLLGIFVVVVGSILGGLASPTESAALGAVATVVAAAAYRVLTWRSIMVSLRETAKVSVMILFIICASITYSQILAFSGATDGLLEIVKGLDLTPIWLVIGMLTILLFLGTFMDQLSMMMITIPFFMPLVATAGVDPVWFGLMMLIALEIGFTTPPFGLLLFVMKGVAPPDITMRQIYWAAAPFIGLEVATIALVMIFPGIALWLPSLLR
ncbi:MAG: TRAP transporter large permease subunit [Rhodospirillales bacterium]